MFSYFAYGLGIHSNIEIPELMPAQVPCDVQITIDIKAKIPAEVPSDRHYLKLTHEETIFFDKNIGTFLIHNGCEITAIPLHGVEDSLIRLCIIGTMFAILLYQRGLFVLHGSAVEVDGGAVLFIAPSGWGKSSITAALHARGHHIISDDVVPVSIEKNTMNVFPGFPQLKLYPEVAEILGHDQSKLHLLHPELKKGGLRVTPQEFSQTSLPLKRIYTLAKDTTLGIEPIQCHEAVIHLVRNSIPTRWVQLNSTSHFLQCANIAKNIPFYTLKRSNDLSSLPTLAQMVVEHLGCTTLFMNK
ncbi:MAG: hypothetical protein HC836_48850 [Richelia sp. RM2_1_2]|nr:hypothetical protein [Richelia sp. RM1_1_1]NJO65712.1 hypothetical protein [Richelia sp. RM2_1_2]